MTLDTYDHWRAVQRIYEDMQKETLEALAYLERGNSHLPHSEESYGMYERTKEHVYTPTEWQALPRYFVEDMQYFGLLYQQKQLPSRIEWAKKNATRALKRAKEDAKNKGKIRGG